MKAWHIHNSSVLLLLSFLLAGCEESIPQPDDKAAGMLIRSELIHEYSSTEIDQILATIGVSDNSSSSGVVRAVKIVYYSPDLEGALQKLSGALLFPVDEQEHPMLSLQHGTVTKRTNVASVSPLNSSAGLSALWTAAQGYITLVPDYMGFGVSDKTHPYLHAESLANSVIDMIRATRVYCSEQAITYEDKLFLSGYSEGGYATLATQKLMESAYAEELVLTAVAPMAGPYDLNATANYVLRDSNYTWPAYIGFMFVAYNDIYEFDNLDDVFLAPYSEQVTEMYDGDYSLFEINNLLPTTENFLQTDFRTSFLAGNEQHYSNVFRENSLIDWSPITPIRLIHGMLDKTVPYSIAEGTRNSLISQGALDVGLVGIPDTDHASAGIPALHIMLDWFSTY